MFVVAVFITANKWKWKGPKYPSAGDAVYPSNGTVFAMDEIEQRSTDPCSNVDEP